MSRAGRAAGANRPFPWHAPCFIWIRGPLADRTKEKELGKSARIVVPVDFSEQSRAAAKRAFYLADLYGAEVHVLHAHTSPIAVLDDARLTDELQASERQAFARFCARLDSEGHPFSRSFDTRDPADAIHSAARESGTALVVLGSHGRRGLDRKVLGSVAERTVQGSPVPVYVARERQEEASGPIRRVLLATDFSKDAEAAESLVATWASRLGTKVEVFHAIRETSVLLAPYAVVGSSDFEGEMMEAAEHRMRRVLARLASEGVSAKSKIAYARPAESILERAESTGTQLVVLGTRGYGGFKRFLLGSVAQRVLRHAPCSVLVAASEFRRSHY